MKIIFFFLFFCLVYSKHKINSIDYDNFINLKKLVNNDEPSKCGYDSCPKLRNDVINVHLISHSHCDAGWLKTVDQYYYGNRNLIQRAGVQYIINNAIDELLKDPSRKFIFVESVFFKKWWDEQTNERKNIVKKLVNQGRLEFINGGWVMNDEAAAHYISIIDQMTYGHIWLQENLGNCAIPKIGWQIDPFGHSKEQASLFAQMGFDGLFFGRLDFHDKMKRKLEKSMELIWKGDEDLGEQSDLFTGILPNNYNPPIGFCFDDTCEDEPIIEDEKSTDYNVKRRINEFLIEVDKQAKYYRTNNLIMTMGSDFQYQNAYTWFHNLDKIIKHMKKINDSVNVFYSTPTCYLKSLNDAKLTWTTKNDDFFPYSSDHDAFWAGYFTSRPSFKGFERWASSHFQSTKHLQVLAGLNTEEDMNLKNELNEALAVSQHHDAITGTEKQHVFSDYVLHLDRGVDSANKLISKALDKLYNFGKFSLNTKTNNVEFCKKLNVSECIISESQDKFLVHLYNPISHTIENLVRLPISFNQSLKEIQVVNSLNEKIEFEIVDIPDFVKNLPERKAKANKELTFLVQLKSNSITSYMISFGETIEKKRKNTSQNKKLSDTEVLKGLGFDLYVDSQTGKTQKLVLDDGKEIKFEQSLMYYLGMNGENRNEKDRASGAYIFRPNGTANSFDKYSNRVFFNKNQNLAQVSSQIDSYVAQTVKVHKDLPYIEFDYVIGPIPISDEKGKEIITRFTTDLQSDDIFYTDSNGRQLIKRVRNKRPTYTYDFETEPIASNYYPINSKIELRDESKDLRFSVVTDRSQGGSSLKNGELEIMLHRRLLHDDAFGVGEALNETGTDGRGLIIRCSHFVMLSSIVAKPKMHVNELVLRKTLLPMIAFRKIDSDQQFNKYFIDNAKTNILRTDLPECINLLTLEYKSGMILVRFEHLYGKLDSSKCSKKTQTLNLESLFSKNFGQIDSYVEMTLSANQQKANLRRLSWKYVSNNLNDTSNEEISFGFIRSLKNALREKKSSSVIELKPHEIKTFFMKKK